MSASTTPTRIIQMTDCHLGATSDAKLLGLNTDKSLRDVLQLMHKEQPDIAALICTGDVAIDSEERSYHRFLDILKQYFTCPLAWLPGNHDNAETMYSLKHPDTPAHRTLSIGGWLIVLLNSSVPNHTHGDLLPSETNFLEQTLKAHPDTPTLVMLHHQPIPMGSKWIDQHVVINHEAFWAVVDSHPQVKGISWGHVHQVFQHFRGSQLLLATPSTCVQFKPLCDEFTIDTTMPGYRWLDLYPDGRIETGVSRVSGKDYEIDFHSAGY